MQDKPIKVLIADDEPLVRQGLKAIVDWSKYDMEVVADAANGETAWEEFRKHHPDLVISDIAMPVMDGMELLKKIKEASPETKVLFVSCHSDFKYAQEGIRHGVSGYLLKTSFNEKEIDAYLSRLQAEIKQATAPLRPEASLDVSPELKEQLIGWLSGDGENEVQSWWRRLEKKHPFLRFPLTVVHLAGSSAERLADHMPERLIRGSRLLRFQLGEQGVILLVARELYPECGDWLRKLQLPDEELVTNVRDGLRSAEEKLETIRMLLLQHRYKCDYGLSVADCPNNIVEAVAFMLAHLHEPISAADVADHVGLSRSYFSLHFKRSVGVSFLDFIDKRRLEQAQTLLASSEWRLQDIAEHVGIPDSKYFSKWFRKETGLTPTEYRQQTKIHH